jgi:NADH-quinone oxidoreductase subunit C
MDLTVREYQEGWESEIKSKLESQFSGKLTVTKTETRRVYAQVDRSVSKAVCRYLHDELSFEHCATVIGVDLGEAEQKMQVVYHIDNYTLYKGVVVELTVDVPYDDLHIETVSDIWGGANWHERETWELFGIVFDNHPRLERLLTPDTYEFFPFRKSYKLRGSQ